MSIKFRNKIIIVFKREKRLSKQKEKLEVVVNSKFYIHECLKENGMMFIVNNWLFCTCLFQFFRLIYQLYS